MKNKYTYAKKNITILVVSLLLIYGTSCNKSELLDAKPKSNLSIPSTLQDLQVLLDAPINYTPAIDALNDNYYLSNTYLQTAIQQSVNVYTFSADIYQALGNIQDWNVPYSQIFTANVVLETLPSIQVTSTNQASWNAIKGSALFLRAWSFFNIAQLYAPVYDSATASTNLGIPLRLSPDLNEKSVRSTLSQTYDRILNDLLEARNLLNATVPLANKNRPSLISDFALLSRIYLSIGNYNKAGLYADSSLRIYNSLVDYNTIKISTTKYFPFTNLNNAEVFFGAQQYSLTGGAMGSILNTIGNNVLAGIDSTLLKSYASNDLRKSVFYFVNNGITNLNYGYDASGYVYNGLCTDELYLNRAEAFARAGSTTEAMSDLNSLLINRWKTGTFVPFVSSSSSAALILILTERRKELPFRGVRWLDLRRLNKEGYNISITHIFNGQTYTLAPNDIKYTYPIPPDVIQFSGIQQNLR